MVVKQSTNCWADDRQAVYELLRRWSSSSQRNVIFSTHVCHLLATLSFRQRPSLKICENRRIFWTVYFNHHTFRVSCF
jgi:hypothetical protein